MCKLLIRLPFVTAVSRCSWLLCSGSIMLALMRVVVLELLVAVLVRAMGLLLVAVRVLV